MNMTNNSTPGVRADMASQTENVEIAAEIIGLLLLRMRAVVGEKLASGGNQQEVFGKDGLAEWAVKLAQTVLKLEDCRIGNKTNHVEIDSASDSLTDEDVAILRTFLEKHEAGDSSATP